MRTETGRVTGVILVLYYMDKPGLLKKIVTAQNEFSSIVSSTIHLHIERNKCIEIIAVRGNSEEVRSLSQILMASKGVKQVKVAVIAP
jgi:CopG family nickel-responsive transcriptional regulator